MNEIIFLFEEAHEGGFTACALGYSIFTEADTWDGLNDAAQEAVLTHFEEGIQQIGKITFVPVNSRGNVERL